MATDESDPHNPQSEQAPDEDWGDAVQVVRNDEWGASVLPARREPTEKTVVTVIESEEATPHEGVDGDEEGEVRHGGIKVREITGRKVQRLKPEKPEIEKMPRVEGEFEEAKHEKWEIEDKEWSGSAVFKWKWVAAITLGMIALIVICLVALPKLNPAAQGAAVISSSEQAQLDMLKERELLLENLLQRQEEARELYVDYASAKVIEDILPLIRDAAELEPLIRAIGHQPRVPKDWEVGEGAIWSMHMLNGLPYARLQGELPDFTRFIAFYFLEGDHLLLDWKATTGYGTATFADLVKGEGDASEIRGIAFPSNLYTDSFPEGEYQCYQVESPDGRELIWCYAKGGTEAAARMARMFIGGDITDRRPGPAHVTLRLVRGPGGALGNQWLIEDLLHEQWIKL